MRPIALAMSLVLTLPMVANAARAPLLDIEIEVDYLSRPCYDSDVREPVPLRGAKVVLRSADGKTESRNLDEDGIARFHYRAEPPLEAHVVLKSKSLTVRPGITDDAGEIGLGDPYKLLLGEIRKQGSVRFTLSGNAKAGAANIFNVLRDGMTIAQQTSPAPLPAIDAVWEYAQDLVDRTQDFEGSAYDADALRIYVSGKSASGKGGDEWEPHPLLHELGHHILGTNADPGPDSEGDHSWNEVYRDAPGLVWSEGFAHAFAAIALDSPTFRSSAMRKGDLMWRCARSMDVSDDLPYPAVTPESDYRYAQYNETLVAAVVWDLATELAKTHGSKVGGMRALLEALATSENMVGHAPWGMREVRDALIAGGLEAEDPERHRVFSRIFGELGMGWGTALFLDQYEIGSGAYDARDEGSEAFWELELRLTGPQGFGCSSLPEDAYSQLEGTSSPDWNGPSDPGGLSYTWEDECLGNGYFDYIKNTFPYLASLAHYSDDFSISAILSCTSTLENHDPENEDTPESNHVCTSDRRHKVGLFYGLSSGASGCEDAPFCTSGTITEEFEYDLAVGTTTIVTYDAYGHCQNLLTGQDCSI